MCACVCVCVCVCVCCGGLLTTRGVFGRSTPRLLPGIPTSLDQSSVHLEVRPSEFSVSQPQGCASVELVGSRDVHEALRELARDTALTGRDEPRACELPGRKLGAMDGFLGVPDLLGDPDSVDVEAELQGRCFVRLLLTGRRGWALNGRHISDSCSLVGRGEK